MSLEVTPTPRTSGTAPEGSGPRPATGSALRERERTAWSMLAPNLVLIVVFLLVPLVWAFVTSFQARRAFGAGRFTGLANLERLLGDGVFWRALGNTAIFTVATVPVSLAAGLGLAVLMDKALPGRGLFRTIVYLPIVVSSLVTSLIGLLLFDESVGMVNAALRGLGLGGASWQSDGTLAMVSVVVMTLWARIGFAMVVYLAALQDLDPQVLEAAKVDGAGRWATLVRIIVPSLAPTTFFLLVVNVIWSFQVFDVVYVMTNGGPGYATTMLVTYAYDEGFGPSRDFGYGATVGLVLFLLTALVTAVQVWRNARKGD